MKIKLYTVYEEGSDISSGSSFVTEWQAVRAGKKMFWDNDKDFELQCNVFQNNSKFESWFYGIPVWVKLFLKGF